MRRDVGLALPLGEAPAEHLGHRGEVVRRALGRVDLEAPVVRLLRRATLEHDHRGHRVRASEVGDVEALDADRRHVELEHPLQALERLHPALAPALGAQALLVERQQRVALCQLEDPTLLAALRLAQLHRPTAAARQRIGQRLAPAEPALDDQQRRDRRIAAVVLEHELLAHLRLVALGLVGEVERLAVGEHAVAHLEDLSVGVAAVAPPPRPRRTCPPTRSSRADAPAASAPPAAGCARASPARTPPPPPPRSIRASRSRSIAAKRPLRKSITRSMLSR